MQVLCGPDPEPAPRLVRGKIDKTLVIDTLIPPDPGKYSWAGHLGARMQLPVVEEIERSGTTLVFTNVRSQAEIWYQLLLEARPEWAGHIALHHGSLDRATREWVEQGLKEARCARWSPLRRWTSASTSCRWSACCRSARPRAWPA
jgi:ATP-dependent Lhr-like helicase